MLDVIVPVIDEHVLALRPDFVALSITVRGMHNLSADAAEYSRRQLDTACAAIADQPGWAADHLEAWREAYRSFGAKPNRYPCSAEALQKRLKRDGRTPSMGVIVDLYNAASLLFAIPVGGEDLGRYCGQPRLVRADGVDPFDTIRDGESVIVHPEPGEVVWRDDEGVTCRRWNWRQGVRTRITPNSSDIWFVLERLEPMPMDALAQAGDYLQSTLHYVAPEAQMAAITVDVNSATKAPCDK